MSAIPKEVTIRHALDQALSELDSGKITGARLDAELLMAHTLGHDRAWILAHDTDKLLPKQSEAFNTLIQKRLEHIPVVHLTGSREFYGLDLEITPSVLTPRVETEQMVEWAIKYSPKGSKLIDVGTGSGAIAIAIQKHRPDLQVTASDLGDTELQVAKRNAKKNDSSMTFIQSDLWDNVPSKFTTIVTNLPYLTDDADLMPEVRREPAVALFGGPDGLDLYRRFLEGIPKHLEPGGFLFTECDPWQQSELISLAAKFNLSPVEQGYFILGFKLTKRSLPRRLLLVSVSS